MHTELISMHLSNVNTAILTSDIIQIGIPTLKLRHTHDDFFQATSNLKKKLEVALNTINQATSDLKKKLVVALNTINQATSNLKKKLEVALNTINQATSNQKKLEVALNTINQATSNLKKTWSGIKHHKPSHIKPKKNLKWH